MDFLQKMKYVPEKLRINQYDLVCALNVSYAMVNRWENSKNKPVRMAQVVFNDFCTIRFDESEDK